MVKKDVNIRGISFIIFIFFKINRSRTRTAHGGSKPTAYHLAIPNQLSGIEPLPAYQTDTTIKLQDLSQRESTHIKPYERSVLTINYGFCFSFLSR